MMPVMEFRCANDHSQWPDRKANIGMNIDRPDTTKSNEASQCFQREAKYECRQVDQPNSINSIQGMFAVRRQPIKMFGTMMHFMKTPEKSNGMLQAMTPVDNKITQYDH